MLKKPILLNSYILTVNNMRQLTARQKKYIDSLMKNNDKLSCVDNLSIEEWDKLVEMNDTEILYQEVNKYMYDKWDKNEMEKDPWNK